MRDLRVAREPLRPPVAEITKPRGLAFGADAFVKTQRLGNRVVIGRRMRSDLLELPDVVRLCRGRRLQRPQAGDVLPANVAGIRCRLARAATCAGSSRSSRTRDRSTVNGNCANACAPSTIVFTPRRRASSQICFTGKICPVRFVMWQKCSTFVAGVIAPSSRVARSSIDGGGTGNEICLTRMPSRRTR